MAGRGVPRTRGRKAPGGADAAMPQRARRTEEEGGGGARAREGARGRAEGEGARARTDARRRNSTTATGRERQVERQDRAEQRRGRAEERELVDARARRSQGLETRERRGRRRRPQIDERPRGAARIRSEGASPTTRTARRDQVAPGSGGAKRDNGKAERSSASAYPQATRGRGRGPCPPACARYAAGHGDRESNAPILRDPNRRSAIESSITPPPKQAPAKSGWTVRRTAERERRQRRRTWRAGGGARRDGRRQQRNPTPNQTLNHAVSLKDLREYDGLAVSLLQTSSSASIARVRFNSS